MLKKLVLLAALLLQIGVFSAPSAVADALPEPECFPCAR